MREPIPLFDLDLDSWELEDLVKMHPGRGRSMLDALQATWLGLPRYATGEDRAIEVSLQQIERLRSLGYVQ